MSKLLRLLKHHRQWLILTFCSFCLILLSSTTLPLTAQTTATPLNKAEVIFQGKTLFQVTDAGEFKAQDRAELVMIRLNQALKNGKSDDLPEITLVPQGSLQEIRLDDQTLLTVTDQDANGADRILTQADRWAEQIRNALHRNITERSGEYLRIAIVRAIGILFGTIGLHLLLSWTRRRIIQHINTTSNSHISRWAINLLHWCVRAGLWLTTTLYIANLFPVIRRWSYEFTRLATTSIFAPILTLGNISYSLTDLMQLGIIIITWIVISGVITNWLRKSILRPARVDRGTKEIVATFIRYALLVLGILVLIQAWGINISSLAILASALGLGIGFGLQDLAKNISGGFVLLFERLIQVGDFVEVNSNKGTIERIGTRSTQIRTTDNISIIVPNVRFLEEEVINWSHSNPISRLHIPIGVAYGTDPYQVKATLLEVAQAQENVLSNPMPQVFFKEFGDNSLNFELLIWTDKPDRQLTLISDLNYRIHDSLQTKQIEVPFPQRDLHIKSGQLSLSPETEAALLQQIQKSTQTETQNHNNHLSLSPELEQAILKQMESPDKSES